MIGELKVGHVIDKPEEEEKGKKLFSKGEKFCLDCKGENASKSLFGSTAGEKRLLIKILRNFHPLVFSIYFFRAIVLRQLDSHHI